MRPPLFLLPLVLALPAAAGQSLDEPGLLAAIRGELRSFQSRHAAASGLAGTTCSRRPAVSSRARGA